jgi:dolichol kinase
MYIFDIFSRPFVFKVSREDEKRRTNLGGFITLAVLGLSLAYLVHVSIVFFQRLTPPNIH